MRIPSLLFVAALALVPLQRAAACDSTGQTVAAVMNATVAVYDTAGKYVRDVKKDQVVIGARILACRDSPAHVKVKLADGSDAWLDRLDLKVTGAVTQAPRRCKSASTSKPADQTTPATSGLDPCSP